MENKKICKTEFKVTQNDPNFPLNEEEVLKYWEDINAF